MTARLETQTGKILGHLKSGRSINPMEALGRFGCKRLAARICELRKAGHPIGTQMIEVETRDGISRVAKYTLGRD